MTEILLRTMFDLGNPIKSNEILANYMKRDSIHENLTLSRRIGPEIWNEVDRGQPLVIVINW